MSTATEEPEEYEKCRNAAGHRADRPHKHQDDKVQELQRYAEDVEECPDRQEDKDIGGGDQGADHASQNGDGQDHELQEQTQNDYSHDEAGCV